MRKSLAVVMAASIVAVAGPVWAAGPPYTVSVGGSTLSASHPISSATTGNVQIAITNSYGTNIHTNCVSMGVGGSVQGGAGVNPWATIATSSWTGCYIPGGAASVTPSTSWIVSGYGNATTGLDMISGTVEKISLYFSVANPSVCSYTIKGSVLARFDESIQALTISNAGGLSVSGVVGCLGQVQNGNYVTFGVTIPLTSSDGFINLS